MEKPACLEVSFHSDTLVLLDSEDAFQDATFFNPLAALEAILAFLQRAVPMFHRSRCFAY